MSDQTQKNRHGIWFWVAGIIIIGLISAILIINLKTKKQANVAEPTQTNTSTITDILNANTTTPINLATQINTSTASNTKQSTIIPTYVVAQIPICTSFTYSDWLPCTPNGTQTRTLIKSLPENCNNGSPILSQGCVYKTVSPAPTPVSPSPKPSTPTSPETSDYKNYQKIIAQIKAAPNQTISTNYNAADKNNTTILTWQVKSDGLYLSVKGYVTANPKDQSTMAQIDTNFDGRPERIADNGLPFVDITPSHQYYKEILLSWTTFMTYFKDNLLK